jgi:hypothetical protein
MAPNTIVEKLSKLLSNPIETECQVVYLLCEVRKLLDEPPRRLFTLSLHCHWALHVNLSHTPTTGNFLAKVDDFVSNILGSHSRDETEQASWEKRAEEMFQYFVSLSTLRKELREFLMSYTLPTSLCDDDIFWFKFVTAYGGVIEDGYLRCEDKDRLKTIDMVTFSKGKPTTDSADVPFSMNWEILLKNGDKFVFDGRAYSNPQRAIPYHAIYSKTNYKFAANIRRELYSVRMDEPQTGACNRRWEG